MHDVTFAHAGADRVIMCANPAGTTFRHVRKLAGSTLPSRATATATEAAGTKTGSQRRQQQAALRRIRCGTVTRATVRNAEQAQQPQQGTSLPSEQPDSSQLAAADEPEQQSARQQHEEQQWLHPVGSAYGWLTRQLRIQPSRRHDADIAAIAGPALLSLAADPLLSLVDTAFVGRLGPAELVSLPGVEWVFLRFIMQRDLMPVVVSWARWMSTSMCARILQ